MGLMESTRRAAALASLAGLAVTLAACGSSGPGTSSSTAATSTGTAAIAPFVSIVEPFDPGHPARVETAPARCGGQASTLAIEHCYETRTENVDARINATQSARYAS